MGALASIYDFRDQLTAFVLRLRIVTFIKEGGRKMKPFKLAALAGMLLSPALALADAEFVRARLTGVQEVPSVATVARGEFLARIADNEQSIEYELTYEGLQGNVTQAHIHFA